MATATPDERDEFTPATRRVIAERSGYICAIRGCSTAGPTRDPNDSLNIGEAGHITAASRRGPRYDVTLSAEQRKSATNGIWCCRNCHGLVDGDESRFSPEELVRLKVAAEQRAEERQGIAAERGPDLEAALQAARTASRRLLEQWLTTFRFNQAEIIELDLQEKEENGSPTARWTVQQMAAAMKDNRKVVLSGQPGAGKTITLLQAAQRLADDETGPIPLLISVNAWTSSGQDLATYITQRLTALGVPAAGVPLLFATGRLSLLLNGWNEAPDADQARAGARLQDFLLNQPLTALAVTTRATHNAPSVVLPCQLEVLPLTPAKQVAIVRAAGLPHPDALLREIDGNPILRETVQTPIFLAAAIKLARAGQTIPTTRSGLLESFVRDFELTDYHGVALRTGPCQDFHHRYLAELAAAMTRASTTTLSPTRAQESIAGCSASLVAGHHVGQAGASSVIAEDLVRHHLLVLQPDGSTGYRFIHQQFQEWFAGRWLAAEIRRLAADPAAERLFAFQRDILNRPPWGEALHFAMEELVAAGDQAATVALVRWMVPVDLITAAELSAIGGDGAWREVGAELGHKLRAWHALGDNHEECAAIAMAATGRGDFADLFWPGLEGDEQTMLRTLRNRRPFRVKILGNRWQERVTAWPADREVTLLQEIARRAGPDEKDYAETRARTGPAVVRTAALELLVEQQEYARAAHIMSATPIIDWPEDWYHRVLTDLPPATLAPHAAQLRARFDTTESLTFRHGVVRALKEVRHADWIPLAQAELARAHAELRRAPAAPRDPFNRAPHPSLQVVKGYLEMLSPTQDAWVDEWLVNHGLDDLLWEDPYARRVSEFAEPLLVRLAQRIMTPDNPRLRSAGVLQAVLKSQAPAVADTIVDACLAGLQEPDDTRLTRPESAADRRHWLLHELRDVPAGSVIDAIIRRAGQLTDYPSVAALVELLAAGTALDESLRSRVNSAQRDPLRALIRRVAGMMPDDEIARHGRPRLAVMLGALGAPEDVAVVESWIAEEHARWTAHLRGIAEARAARPMRQVRHYGTSWWSWFEGSLALFGCPEAETVLNRWLEQPEFAKVGANGLLHMSLLDGSLPRLPEGFGQRRRQTTERAPGDIGPAVQPRANAVFRAIESLETRPADNEERLRYVPELAGVLGLLNDARAVPRLLAANATHHGWRLVGTLRCMQQRGAVLPGRQMAAALEPFIAEHETTVRNDTDNWHIVVDAMRLLLLSDDPAAGLDRMRRLPHRRLTDYHGRDIFVLLAESPDPRAGELLAEFSRNIPLESRAATDLVNALSYSRHEVCHRRLLELLRMPHQQLPGDLRTTVETSALQLTGQSPAFEAELVALVRANSLHHPLARMAGLAPSEPMLDALLAQANLRPLEADLHQLVDHLSDENEPTNSPTVVYVWPADATAVKLKLAAVFATGGTNGEVASRVLAFLRLKRSLRGQAPQEPLHPDIMLLQRTGPTWPV